MEKRSLSGIFFRFREADGKWGNRTFEDLSEEDQDRVMGDRNVRWIKSLAKQLAATIRRLGDRFDMFIEYGTEPELRKDPD